MSSVSIAGDTSGSILLAAPSVAGANTATLPAATGTVMVSGNIPAFRATMSGTQTISNNTNTKVLFDTETFDTNSNFNTSNNRFTPTVAGYYKMDLALQVNTGVAGRTYALLPRFYKNGVAGATDEFDIVTAANAAITCPVLSDLVYMNGTTDYLEAYFYSYDFSAGATVNISYGGEYNRFTGFLVRAA